MSIILTTPAVVFTKDSDRDGAVVFAADSATLAAPRKLTVRRALPKKTNTYPGNARNVLKLHWSVVVGEEISPFIAEVSFSRMATVPTGTVTDVRGIMSELIVSSTLDSFFASLVMPA